jgi:hypothetical protein
MPCHGSGGYREASHCGCHFDSGSVLVRFVVDKVALGQVSLPVLQFPLSVSFHQCSILIVIYMLLLPEGQRVEDWNPPKKQCSFKIVEHWLETSSFLNGKYVYKTLDACQVEFV